MKPAKTAQYLSLAFHIFKELKLSDTKFMVFQLTIRFPSNQIEQNAVKKKDTKEMAKGLREMYQWRLYLRRS